MESRKSQIEPSAKSYSTDGYSYFEYDSEWVISRTNNIRFYKYSGKLDTALMLAYKKMLSKYVKTYSPAHVANIDTYFYFLVTWICDIHGQIREISGSSLIGYRSQLIKEKEYHLGSLSSFLKKWALSGIPGLASDVHRTLSAFTLSRNLSGHLIERRDPDKGALSDLQYESLNDHLVHSWERDDISLEEYLLVTILIATGRRPIQIADLKVRDFIECDGHAAGRAYFLNTPRRKQRHVGFRGEFKVISLTPEIGACFSSHLKSVRDVVRGLVSHVDGLSVESFPLFPNWKKFNKWIADNKDVASIRDLPEDFFHRDTSSVAGVVKKATRSWTDPSVHGAGSSSISPRRLRYTMATRAAKEGYGAYVIAEMLDHETVDYARVYTENVPEHVEAINKAVALQMAPYAQAFVGRSVSSAENARWGEEDFAVVKTQGGSEAGACGTHAFCNAAAPIACYTCTQFRPWVDAPHEELLGQLIAERDRIYEVTKDKPVTTVQDRAIFAVAEVVKLCEKKKREQ